MLLILSGMILAVVIVSGIEISSNSMLLSARKNAQFKAKSADPISTEQNSEIGDWSYSKLDLGLSRSRNEELMHTDRKVYKLEARGRVIQIPFSYQARKNGNSDVFTLDNVSGKLNSRYDSNSGIFLQEGYSWRKLNNFDSAFKHDFSDAVRSGNAFNAANMVRGYGSTGSTSATINDKDQAEGESSAENAAEIMYKSFEDIFGINLNNIKMREHPTNTVYLPIF